ncbi:DNA primase small subunit [Nymphaea thermarum]|nr:DNA primase small subunit [Nymphaea thermarum]
MVAEENRDGADDMAIDEPAPHNIQRSVVPNEFDQNYLRVYYGRLFPYDDFYRWMSYGNDGKHPACDTSFIGRREFSFTLENNIFLRFQSFSSRSELEKSVKEKCPFKIDIGPVYSVDPAKRNAYARSGDNAFVPVEKELVFDIDISDYDDVRYCCSGADVCIDCWPLMTVAIKVLDVSLREDFGFNHILWVYSGRRGVHCWVCDHKARRLTNEQRAAIAHYFRVNRSNENNKRKVTLSGPALHPFLTRSYNILQFYFEEKLLSSQSYLASEESIQRILDMIPDESISSQLQEKWQKNHQVSSGEDVNVARWKQLKRMVQSGKQKVQGLRRSVEEIVFCHTYPRLDMEVSKHMNHLLKSPFCVHPKTGRVCIPIDPSHSDQFDPTAVPTLSGLLEELNMRGHSADTEGWEGTSLAESIKFFRSSFLQPLLKTCKADMEAAYRVKVQGSKNGSSW